MMLHHHSLFVCSFRLNPKVLLSSHYRYKLRPWNSHGQQDMHVVLFMNNLCICHKILHKDTLCRKWWDLLLFTKAIYLELIDRIANSHLLLVQRFWLDDSVWTLIVRLQEKRPSCKEQVSIQCTTSQEFDHRVSYVAQLHHYRNNIQVCFLSLLTTQ